MLATKLPQLDMFGYLLSVLVFVCILQAGVCNEECNQAVVARRQVFYVSVGGSLSLSCVVRHCGDNWTGAWMWKNSTDEVFNTVNESARHHMTRVILSDNKTRLVLETLRVNQSDEGSYGCRVTWNEGATEQGHLMYLNVTTGVPSQRDIFHRIVICTCAFLCLPIILGLARCLSSGVKPQPLPVTEFTYAAVCKDPRSAPKPPPRRPIPQKRNFPHSHKAPPKPLHKTEVVYADISHDSVEQQGVTRMPVQSTVYSLLNIS